MGLGAQPRAHAGNTAGDADPPPSTTMGDSAHCSAAAHPGPNARAAPAASPGTSDAKRGGTLLTGHPQAGGGDMYRPDNRGHRAHAGRRTKDDAHS